MFDYTVEFKIPNGCYAGFSYSFDLLKYSEDEILRSASTQMNAAGLLSPVETEEGSGCFDDYLLDSDEFNSLFKAFPVSPLWEQLGFDVSEHLEYLLLYAKEIDGALSSREDALEIWLAARRLFPDWNIDSIDFAGSYVGQADSLESFADSLAQQYARDPNIPDAVRFAMDLKAVRRHICRHHVRDEETGHIFQA